MRRERLVGPLAAGGSGLGCAVGAQKQEKELVSASRDSPRTREELLSRPSGGSLPAGGCPPPERGRAGPGGGRLAGAPGQNALLLGMG